MLAGLIAREDPAHVHEQLLAGKSTDEEGRWNWVRLGGAREGNRRAERCDIVDEVPAETVALVEAALGADLHLTPCRVAGHDIVLIATLG